MLFDLKLFSTLWLFPCGMPRMKDQKKSSNLVRHQNPPITISSFKKFHKCLDISLNLLTSAKKDTKTRVLYLLVCPNVFAAVTQGFSWGFTIFCIIWEILIMLPMQMSLPRYKRGKVVKQPTHPLFRPDPEGGGIVIPQDMVESEDNTQPGFLSKPNIFPTASRTFLDSLPDERNVYVYDEEEGAIKPKTVSRNTGSRVGSNDGKYMGQTTSCKIQAPNVERNLGKEKHIQIRIWDTFQSNWCRTEWHCIANYR